MSQLRVFLSHSSSDNGFAEALVHGLREAGAGVWYDEQNLGGGVLRDEIMRQLVNRPVFIVLLSRAAFTSQWVRDECEWAYNLYRRKPQRLILPVTAAPYDPDDFDRLLYLESMRRVEGPSHRPYSKTEALDRTLRLLTLTPLGQAVAPAVPQPSEGAADLVLRGKGLAAQKHYDESVLLFKRATSLEPGNWDAWFNLGYVQGKLGSFKEGLAAYEQALTLKPGDSATWNNKARALIILHRYQEALVAAERAIALQQDAKAWITRAGVLFSLGRYQEALVAAERATNLQPQDAKAWITRAGVLFSLGRYQEALVAAERATNLQPRDAKAWIIRGLVLGKLGRAAEADDAKRRSSELGG